MAGSSSSDPVDRQLWALDPVFAAHVKLIGAQLSRLPDAVSDGSVLLLGGHPIRYVDVVGIVIMMNPKNPVPAADKRVAFTLDDGSGALIECIHWLDTELPIGKQRQVLEKYRLGALMHVQGRLGRYRQTRQVTVDQKQGACWAELDPTAECLHWVRARELWNKCYSRPFQVPDGAVEEMNRLLPQQQQQQQQQQRQPPTAAQGAAVAELTDHVHDIMKASDGEALTTSAVVAKLPASAKRALPASSNLRDVVAQALRTLEDQSIVYAEDGPRGRNRDSLWRFAR